MYSPRPIILVNGLLIVLLGLFMAVPMMVDLAYDNADWRVFLMSGLLTVFTGGVLVTGTFNRGTNLSIRQAFILTTSVWVVLPAFASLPFIFSDLGLTVVDAYFEAMSGLTTTGATVIVGLDAAPPGLLIWRAILQWLGGIGIIVMAIGVLPILQVGGMQLFRMESSDRSEKVLPRATQLAGWTALIYLGLTLACAFALWHSGLTAFDSLAHAMTTLSTGGFSTSDSSVGYFDNAAAHWIIVVFMLLASLPFILYVEVLRGRAIPLVTDTQVRWFFVTIIATIVLVVFLARIPDVSGTEQMMRLATFNVVSIVTGTGYATADYGNWGAVAPALFFFMMFIGGCAGSTSCSIKIFRFRVMFENARIQITRLLSPNRVILPKYNGRPIETSVIDAVMTFFLFFVLIYGVLAILLSLTGVDLITALSGAASAIANVGPGLGDVIGPAGTFEPLPDSAKWILCAGMLLGRLELFTMLVLFTRRFWQA